MILRMADLRFGVAGRSEIDKALLAVLAAAGG
jgi:hypothetical protein